MNCFLKLLKLLKHFERLEYNQSSSFWLFTISIYFCLPSFFSQVNQLINQFENHSQVQTVIQKVRAGDSRNQQTKVPVSRFSPQVPSQVQKPETTSFSSSQRTKFGPSKGAPNPSGSDSSGFDETIGSQQWENWVCPEPDQIISRPDFWLDVAGNKEEATCLDNLDDIDEDAEDEQEEETIPRRRLLELTPTWKLDQKKIAAYDYTQKKLQLMEFPSREGLRLKMDHRSVRKAVYGHPMELGLSDLGSRIECPVQSNPDLLHQRIDCWAITDVNIREAVIKIFELTTFPNPNVVTLQKYPGVSSNQKATYFIDTETGNAAYFRIGGQQDGKLWSMEHFDRDQIIQMIEDPDITKITDVSKFNF